MAGRLVNYITKKGHATRSDASDAMAPSEQSPLKEKLKPSGANKAPDALDERTLILSDGCCCTNISLYVRSPTRTACVHCPHALPTTRVSELRCLSAARDPGVHRLLREERVSLPAGAVLPQARHRAVPDRLSVARGSLVHGRAPVLHVLGQVHRYVLQVAAALPLLCRGVRAPDRRRGCAEFTSNACVCDC